MSTDEFEHIIKSLAGYTEYIYLHVMGEPLLHPQLCDIIDIANNNGFKVCITTNGTLIEKNKQLLLSRCRSIYKISVSLHSHQANDCMSINEQKYIQSCIDFVKQSGLKGTISVLRLWNLDGAINGINERNDYILQMLRDSFPDEWKEVRGGPKIGDHVYLEYGERFEWPDLHCNDYGEKRFCMGLNDHIGILCDGTVVPCCLDSDGTIALGNIFDVPLDNIICSDRALKIKNGFADNKAVEALCRHCGYSLRFL